MKLAKRSATGLLAFRSEATAVGEDVTGLQGGDHAFRNITIQNRADGSTNEDEN